MSTIIRTDSWYLRKSLIAEGHRSTLVHALTFHASHSHVWIEVLDAKRRRKQDLNTRYDRMIETMQMTRIYPKERTSANKAVSARHSTAMNHHRKNSRNLPKNALCKAKDSLRGRFHLDNEAPLPVNLANAMETVSMNRETLQSNCLGQVYSPWSSILSHCLRRRSLRQY